MGNFGSGKYLVGSFQCYGNKSAHCNECHLAALAFYLVFQNGVIGIVSDTCSSQIIHNSDSNGMLLLSCRITEHLHEFLIACRCKVNEVRDMCKHLYIAECNVDIEIHTVCAGPLIFSKYIVYPPVF